MAIFLFNSFRIDGLRNFIIQKEFKKKKKKGIQENTYGIKKVTRTNIKITILKTNFSRLVYNALENKRNSEIELHC